MNATIKLSTGMRAIVFLTAIVICGLPARAQDAAVQLEGWGFTIDTLGDGVVAFSNRDYVFREVPDRIAGWQFTRLNGGENAARFTAKRDSDGLVYMVTAIDQAGADMTGWQPEDSGGFHYSDGGKTRLYLLSRHVQAGEPISIPQGNWAGGIVVAPQLTGRTVEIQPDHSLVPGVVIAHLPAASGIYIGSPGIVVCPDGSYLAKHDEFGPGSTERISAVSHVYRSVDRGQSWEHLARVEGLFWANIFYHEDALYLMGTSAGHFHGRCVIRRSTDGGRTWTEARDAGSGLLFPGLSYATAPMPMVIHNGRIWRAMEDEKGGDRWGLSFRAFMMSAPVDANLLDAASWTASNAIPRNPRWLDGKFGGWLEGNAVVDPNGQMVNILRVSGVAETAAIVRVSADGTTATFDPANDFIPFYGGATKFTIRYDDVTGRHWSLVNKQRDPAAVRNRLVLVSSADLRTWVVEKTLLEHPDGGSHAFQYVDWLFEGDDIIAVSRTAYDDGLGGAHNAHDANYLTFHRFKRFRMQR